MDPLASYSQEDTFTINEKKVDDCQGSRITIEIDTSRKNSSQGSSRRTIIELTSIETHAFELSKGNAVVEEDPLHVRLTPCRERKVALEQRFRC